MLSIKKVIIIIFLLLLNYGMKIYIEVKQLEWSQDVYNIDMATNQLQLEDQQLEYQLAENESFTRIEEIAAILGYRKPGKNQELYIKDL